MLNCFNKLQNKSCSSQPEQVKINSFKWLHKLIFRLVIGEDSPWLLLYINIHFIRTNDKLASALFRLPVNLVFSYFFLHTHGLLYCSIQLIELNSRWNESPLSWQTGLSICCLFIFTAQMNPKLIFFSHLKWIENKTSTLIGVRSCSARCVFHQSGASNSSIVHGTVTPASEVLETWPSRQQKLQSFGWRRK